MKVAYALGLLLHFAQTSAQTPARSRPPPKVPPLQSGTAPVPSAGPIKALAFWIYDARVEGRQGGDTPRCLPCAAAQAGGGEGGPARARAPPPGPGNRCPPTSGRPRAHPRPYMAALSARPPLPPAPGVGRSRAG